MKDSSDEPYSEAGTAKPDSVNSSLLNRLRTHSPDAWKEFVRLFLPVLYQQGRRSGLQPEDARDVAQEVLKALSTDVGNYRRDGDHSSFRGWLWTLTRNKIVDCLRRQGRVETGMGGSSARDWLNQLPAREQMPCEDQFSASLYQRALALIESEFEENTVKAFLRCTRDECRTADVAEELGMTSNAVYIAKSRVLRRLREELGELAE